MLVYATHATAAPPEVDYMLHCMGCHVADGSGAPGKVPSLKGYMARFLSLDEGRRYLVSIPGVTQTSLSDADVATLTNWMLARFDPEHMPEDFTPYTAEEIARYRREPLTEVNATRERLIERIERTAGAGR
jgi:mono/diheme cytochrome c family protein